MSNTMNLMAAISNKTMLEILMGVLIVFILLLAVLGIVFVIALRKRAPVIKVIMAPTSTEDDDDEDEQDETAAVPEVNTETKEAVEEPKQGVAEDVKDEVVSEVKPEPKPEPKPALQPDPEEDENDDDGPSFVIEGQERVRYDRSLTAKICQLKGETKDWYTEIKNELMSYERVKDRMSWRRESFRIGRMTFARLTIRGKTLCLMLAVEPDGYSGTKYAVEDVSNVNSTADTPTLYRIKSERRLKYAKEMLAGVMKELKCYKNSHYEPKDFFLPYEGDMALMQKGLVKRIVVGSTRTFKIEEVSEDEFNDAINNDEQTATVALQGETLPNGDDNKSE